MKQMDTEELLKLLKNQRHSLRLTQKKLSELSGVPLGTIASLESGRSKDPTMKTLLGLAPCLGLVFVIKKG